MGKLGKAAKKRKINAQKSIFNSAAEGALGGKLEKNGALGLDAERLKITLQTLTELSRDELLFHSKECRPIRQLLFQLVDLKQNQGVSLTQRISLALKDARWNEAIYLLSLMREKKQIPKLGALQRWTRDLDAVDAESDPLMIRVLDAILRTVDPSTVGIAEPELPPMSIKKLPPFESFSKTIGKLKVENNFEKYSKNFKVVYQEAGSERKPPNKFDMVLYSGTIPSCNPPATPVTSIKIPNLPNVTILKNVLSIQECCDIVSAAESIGFTPDVPKGGSAKEMNSILAENFMLLAENELVNRIYERCLPHLPQTINDQAVAGINARWRVYKYSPGSIYRPHIDGAWPGSGLDKNGNYIYDAYGDRWSKLTFLIRLNDEFKGGATTFFTPSSTEGVLDAQPVSPGMGDVLLFTHGDNQGSLLHEGSPVLDSNGEFIDVKYVVRTEVLYLIPGHTRKDI